MAIKRPAPEAKASPASEPPTKRRSARLSTTTATPTSTTKPSASKTPSETIEKPQSKPPKVSKASKLTKPAPKSSPKPQSKAKPKTKTKSDETSSSGPASSRAVSEDPDIATLPDRNPEAPRHEGEWYWLMKAEPETRLENGIDVSFSIDNLRAKKEPEPWDGIRAYAARNNLRNMNLGDKAFFYHSNCKEPGIVGIMEIVKEFSEDKSARRPGTPYYDPSSTRENPRWSLVHVRFLKKFAVPINLRELRELGAPGKPLENMPLLKQSRLSVSRVGASEWEFLCGLADEKAEEAGKSHET